VNLLALRAARSVLAISEATRADYIRHLGARPEKIVTVPLAANPAFSPTGDRGQEAGGIANRKSQAGHCRGMG
jgi:hypothetical protein